MVITKIDASNWKGNTVPDGTKRTEQEITQEYLAGDLDFDEAKADLVALGHTWIKAEEILLAAEGKGA